jgi:hypothetical protein
MKMKSQQKKLKSTKEPKNKSESGDYFLYNNFMDEREAKESLGIVHEIKQRTANNLFSSFSYYQED